jgi:hypothetical protein
MHPVLASPQQLLLYLLAWSLPALLLAYLIWTPGGFTAGEALALAGPLCVFYAFVCLSPQIQCRRLPIRSTPLWRLLANHGGAASLAGLLLAGLALVLAMPEALSRFFPGLYDRVSGRFGLIFVTGVLYYAVSVVVHYVLCEIEAVREAEVLAREAELRALKAQINPHFLFNALNSISALTAVDAARAREMCIRLSEFLRSTLGLGERTTVGWNEELSLAEAYLAVEKIRFGDRLRVSLDAAPECAPCQVPSLILQPLVENAIKHGIASLVEGGEIRLRARAGAGKLVVVVENPYDPDSPAPRRSGLGLRNIRGRLEARYGARASLQVQNLDHWFRVEIHIPCEDAER